MSTGERIKARRKQLGISADTLAERVGVSRATVFRWEKGEIEKVDAKVMNNVAVALNTTARYLIGLSDDPNEIEVIEPLNETADAPPKTIEARIVSFGMDQLPKEDREQLLNVFHLWCSKHPDLFVKKDKKGDDDNEA